MTCLLHGVSFGGNIYDDGRFFNDFILVEADPDGSKKRCDSGFVSGGSGYLVSGGRDMYLDMYQ